MFAFAGAFAQTPQAANASVAPPVPVTPLKSSACPTVHVGERVSLDWNPGFDIPGAVTGLKTFVLIFKRDPSDGFVTDSKIALAHAWANESTIAPLGNGYFHIEARLWGGRILPGVYNLVGADAEAAVQPDYQGQAPKLTVSPAREHFCINVVHPSATASTSSQTGG